MPGGYTHITLVNEAAERRSLEALEGFPPAATIACGKWRKFCELGVVSPDYPYLHIISTRSKNWANLMHYERTDGVIKSAIRRLRQRSGVAQEKGLAWLLGYTAHVVMDVTMHPVINLRVGPYESNKREHRVCEMNQDVYVFERLGLTVPLAEHLDTGIARCADSEGNLDPDIEDLWLNALSETYPKAAAANTPNLKAWHRSFQLAVDKIAEEGGWLSAISRHVARDVGITYPRQADLDMSYIAALPRPDGGTIHFDELFDMAKRNVHRVWTYVAAGALGFDDQYRTMIQDWSLDTGKDAAGRLVFWGHAA